VTVVINLSLNKYCESKSMIIKQLIVGSMSVCAYIVVCEKTKKGAVIDPGGDEDRILDEVERRGATI
jgi:hydroxyacylglutathione hydrolase